MFSTMIRITLAVGVLAFAASAMQTTIWVDAIGGDDGSLSGSQGAPYATISKAVEVANGTPATAFIIKVVEGDYTQAHEDDFGGFPISITNPNVRIEGASSDPEEFPRLGGDVNVSDSSVRALFDIVADDVTLSDVRLQKLHFVAESIASRDAPGAVRVEVLGGGIATVKVESCVIERFAMNNGSAADDRPSIHGVGGNGELTLEVRACGIIPTRRAGVQMSVGSDCLNVETNSGQVVTVDSCTFLLSGDLASDAAVDLLYEAINIDRSVSCTATIIDNIIDSRGANDEEDGFVSGIRYGAVASGEGAAISLNHTSPIYRNEIMGCRSEGMLFLSTAFDDGTASTQNFLVRQNRIHDNWGDGIVIDGDDTTSYLRIYTMNNLLWGNRNGLVVKDASAGGGGAFAFVNDTYADNENYGLVIDDGSPIDFIINTISYYNGDGSWYSADGWVIGDMAVDTFLNNNWYGESGAFAPGFVDHSNGDYHLASTSGCRNAGLTSMPENAPDLEGPDVYGGRRFAEYIADMGADEYDPEE